MSENQPLKLFKKDKILIHLLVNEKLTQGEIADKCGYRGKGKDKYSYFTDVLNQLKNLGIIETDQLEEDEESVPEYYRIPRNFDIINSLYYDLFKDLQPFFRQSPWLIDLIIERRLVVSQKSPELIINMERMLKASPKFFETFLKKSYDEVELIT